MHTINVKYLLVVFLLGFLVVPSTPSQTLADWQEALAASKRGKGCESIPYSTERTKCINASAEVEESCKKDAWSCDAMGTKSLKASITALSVHIDNLKTERKDLQGKELTAKNKQISEKTAILADLEKRLEADLDKIKDRHDRGEKCLKARKAVQVVFKRAEDAAQSVSVPNIKVIAEQLIDYWQTKGTEHQKALADVELGVKKCEKCQKGVL